MVLLDLGGRRVTAAESQVLHCVSTAGGKGCGIRCARVSLEATWFLTVQARGEPPLCLHQHVGPLPRRFLWSASSCHTEVPQGCPLRLLGLLTGLFCTMGREGKHPPQASSPSEQPLLKPPGHHTASPPQVPDALSYGISGKLACSFIHSDQQMLMESIPFSRLLFKIPSK